MDEVAFTRKVVFMAKLRNGELYEFCENLYIQLDSRDDGYYATNHDRHVFCEASKKFDISEEEAKTRYLSFEKFIAKKLELELKRLPIKEREAKRMRILQDILKNNRDLPYHDLEGPATKKIKSGLITIYEEFPDISKQIGESGWTLPMSMTFYELDKLKSKKIDIQLLDHFFAEFFKDNKFTLLVKHVNKSEISDEKKKIFNECVEAFHRSNYMIVGISLLALLEGILSEFHEDKRNIRMMMVCREQRDLALSNNKMIKYIIWISFYEFVSQLYKKSDFNSNEPEIINRHWILHGRSKLEIEKVDCLRIFNAIYTLTSMLKFIK